MSESFGQAAGRHLYDAKVLLEKQRWNDAVYLTGYLVECFKGRISPNSSYLKKNDIIKTHSTHL